MADTVQYLMEQMIPELEDFERRGLFTKAEIKQIVKRRSNFEYNLKRRRALKEDYLRYIEYESNLEALRQHRKASLLKELQVRNPSARWRKTISDRCINRRIMFIYERATRKFKGDLALWLQYLEFCRKNGAGRIMQRVIIKALRLHPTRPGLWIYAAAWEFEGQQNTTAARVLMQRGIRMCPKAQELWLEFLRMELVYAQRLEVRRKVLGLVGKPQVNDKSKQAEDEQQPETSTSGLNEFRKKVSLTLHKNAIAAIPSDPGFRQKLLEVLARFEFEGKDEVEEAVYKSLAADFPKNEQCWEIRALRPLLEAQGKGMEAERQARRQVDKVFEEALEALPSAGMYERYVEYLEGVLDIAVAESAPDAESAAQKLLDTFEKARSAGFLTEAMATRHIGLLLQCGHLEEARTTAAQACQGSFKTSGNLWFLRLNLERQLAGLSKEEHGDVNGESPNSELQTLVEDALEKVPLEEAKPTWTVALEHFAAVRTPVPEVLARVASALSAGGRSSVGEALACAMVDWALQIGGLGAAREAYSRLLALPGPAAGLLKHCAALESTVFVVGDLGSLTRIRQILEQALGLYGREDTDLWLQYCRQEIKAGEMERATALYWRAKKSLSDPSRFLECYER